MRIYLADPGHNLLTTSSDVFPLGVANQATYLPTQLPPDCRVEIQLFREPQELKRALDAAPPDVLALSNYAWNEELSGHFASYAKRLSPTTLTCMGGPNWPLAPDVKETFLRNLPDLDAYIDGPTYEGERGFGNLIRRFHEGGCSLEAIFEQPVAGATWIDPRSGAFVPAPPVERLRDLDEIPSPYLAGLMDPFFQTGYFPLLQIARGCPFSCTFCNSGVPSNNRVSAHSIENVQRDLLYIAERVKPTVTLCLADDNFGMYQRDEPIADYIGWLQKRYGWPRYIRTTTGKNKGERIIRVMRTVGGVLPMTAAVQSLDPEVLKNIKRSNIKLDTYGELMHELRSHGMQSYGELILCLPGETKESFLRSVRALLDAGCKRISAHQLMLLHGAELATTQSRQRFGLSTRFRVVARNIGTYTGEPVIEVEEMVVETPTFSFEAYLEVRVFHLLLTIFYYEGNFEEAFEFARHNGVDPFDLMVRMQSLLGEAPPEFRKVMDDFVEESQSELFATKDDCLTWARAHYDGLVDNRVGGNLLSKYSMLGRFYATRPALDFLGHSILAAAPHLDPDELEAVMGFLRAVILHAPFAETMATVVEWNATYDIEQWAAEGYARPLADFRTSSPRSFRGRVDPQRKDMMEKKVEMFGEHPGTLGKFTRTMFARDLRRTLVPDADSDGARDRG